MTTFEALYAAHVESRAGESPAAELLAFVQEIAQTYPCITQLEETHADSGVWSDGPLVGNVTGPLLHLGIVWSRAEEVCEFLVERATARGLVVFDPQTCERRRFLRIEDFFGR